jgi:hypothetical protein
VRSSADPVSRIRIARPRRSRSQRERCAQRSSPPASGRLESALKPAGGFARRGPGSCPVRRAKADRVQTQTACDAVTGPSPRLELFALECAQRRRPHAPARADRALHRGRGLVVWRLQDGNDVVRADSPIDLDELAAMLSASSAVASARAGLSFTSRTPCSVHSTDDMSVGIALMVLSRRPPTAAASTLSPRRSGRKPGARAVKQVARRPGRASPRSCRSNEEVGEVAHGLLVVLRSVPRVGDTERQHGRLALVGGAHSGSAKLSASRHGSRPGPTSARPAARRRRT